MVALCESALYVIPPTTRPPYSQERSASEEVSTSVSAAVGAALEVAVATATATGGARPGGGGGSNRAPLGAAPRLGVSGSGVVSMAALPSTAMMPIEPITGAGKGGSGSDSGRRAMGQQGQEAGVQGQGRSHDEVRQKDQHGGQEEEDSFNPRAPDGSGSTPAAPLPAGLRPGPLAVAPVGSEHGWVARVWV